MKTNYDRIHNTVNSRLIMRTLLNIANGYESSKSSILENRTINYRAL